MRLRPVFVVLHRYAGLSLAIFLAVAGLTGSAISFNEELDALLNPSLFTTTSRGTPLSPSVLIRRVEQALPGTSVTYVPLTREPGKTVLLNVEPKSAKALAFDQVFADPVTGRVLGTRQWGACCVSPLHLMPFLYLLHYTLQVPGVWGVWLMGIVAIVWAVDCFVGFALTLPRARPFWRKWKISWRVKSGAGGFRFHLDLHRAGGLWLWLLLFMLATSGVALNLPEQVFRPAVSLFATLKPSLEQQEAKRFREVPRAPKLSYDDAVARAIAEGRKLGWHIAPVSVFRYASYGTYIVGFTRDGESEDTGLGSSYFYLDDQNGSLVQRDIAGQGSAGDVYVQAQYQLHTGRILGLPGRILICLSGIAVAILSVTGVYIWLRKGPHKRAHFRLRKMQSAYGK